MKFRFHDMIAFNLEGGGGAAASGGDSGNNGGGAPQGAASGGDNLASAAARAAAAASPGGQQQQQSGGQEPQQQQQSGGEQQNGQQPKAYYPENLPEALRGTNDRETIDKLCGEVASRPKPPATAKDYKYEFEKDFTDKFGDLKDDPVLPMWSEIALELGLDNKTAQAVVPKLFDKLAKAGLIAPPVDMDKELLKLEPNETDPVRRASKAATRVNAIGTKLQGLQTRGILNKTDMVRLSTMYLDADAVMTYEKIINLIPDEHGLQSVHGAGPGGGETKDTIKAKMNDPRYDSLNPKYDAAYRKQVDAEWRRLHGAQN